MARAENVIVTDNREAHHYEAHVDGVLAGLRRWPVDPDRLAEPAPGEPSDGEPGAQQRADHRQSAAQEQCPHEVQPLVR
ncbi:hypothetical protein [Nocardioides sp. Root151]|uniref:hypothetical protein n=1 Tax=Nocardioides sp. Root151 TaxID=1736475 RepID=UPI000B310745|nr:hypothetical protein [Nocardioides sp. Root151]